MNTEPLPPSAIAALQAGNKLHAIKLMREATGMGLKEAKESVEAYIAEHPSLQAHLQTVQSKAEKSLLKWIVMTILVVAAAMYLWPR